MSARGKLLEALRLRTPGPWVAAPEDDALANEILNEHARELTAKQRAAIEDIMESWGGDLHQDMMDDLIEVIDPDKQ